MLISIEIDSRRAIALWRQAGGGPLPAFPDGANTLWRHFLCRGRPALLVRQRGFRRRPEEAPADEAGGCTVAVAMDGEPDAARAGLEAWVQQMLPPVSVSEAAAAMGRAAAGRPKKFSQAERARRRQRLAEVRRRRGANQDGPDRPTDAQAGPPTA
jgi:hypothetical protein